MHHHSSLKKLSTISKSKNLIKYKKKHRRRSLEKVVPENFAKFIGKRKRRIHFLIR